MVAALGVVAVVVVLLIVTSSGGGNPATRGRSSSARPRARPALASAPSARARPLTPATVTVAVLNGTATANLAK